MKSKSCVGVVVGLTGVGISSTRPHEGTGEVTGGQLPSFKVVQRRLFRHSALSMRLSLVARLPGFPGWSALPGKLVWVIETVVKVKVVVTAEQEDKLMQDAGVPAMVNTLIPPPVVVDAGGKGQRLVRTISSRSSWRGIREA